MPKPKVYRMCDDYFRPKLNVYTKSAHFATFGAETETETEILPTSTTLVDISEATQISAYQLRRPPVSYL